MLKLHYFQVHYCSPIMWDDPADPVAPNFYTNNPTFAGQIKQLILDLVTRSYMNGLAQYGVKRGSVDNPIFVTGTIPATNVLSPTNIETNLSTWLNNGTSIPPITPNVTRAPAVNERSLIYNIILGL